MNELCNRLTQGYENKITQGNNLSDELNEVVAHNISSYKQEI